jgi:hypothetical protein
MEDGVRGFPAFLANQFIGNARHQLLMGLQRLGLLSKEEIDAAVTACSKHLAKVSKKTNACCT